MFVTPLEIRLFLEEKEKKTRAATRRQAAGKWFNDTQTFIA